MTKRKISRGRQSRAPSPSRFPTKSKRNSPASAWLYGGHAVLAALGNPARRCRRLLTTKEAQASFGAKLTALGANRPIPAPEETDREELSRLLPPGAVHQGLALLADPLPEIDLTDLLAAIEAGTAAPDPDGKQNSRLLVVLLDQVTDPHNVGAILRSAAAFGAAAVVAPRHHAAPQTGVLAKAASGALEHIPYIQTTNLGRALEQLKVAGLWCIGLDGSAERSLAKGDPGGPLALVLGAEGRGLRRLSREKCDLLLKLPTTGPIASLNVSNAAAVALYQLAGET